YADAANIGGGNPETIAEKIAILKQHCDTVGRDFAEITRSTSLTVFPNEPGEDPQRATERARGGVEWEQFAAQTIIGTEEQI
ncbi:hypothetical protein ACQ1Z2_16070, partial [Enterococcus faecalis]|uniref:hypothetical protein n=1 Tax=Enterococcus faecalis TaxID=1351 RepID=UPI003D6BA41D